MIYCILYYTVLCVGFIVINNIAYGFYGRSQNWKERLLDSTCPSMRPSAWKKLGSHWTDFH